MLMDITAPDLTLLFLGTVFCLGAAFVWLFCEFERSARKRKTAQIGASSANGAERDNSE